MSTMTEKIKCPVCEDSFFDEWGIASHIVREGDTGDKDHRNWLINHDFPSKSEENLHKLRKNVSEELEEIQLTKKEVPSEREELEPIITFQCPKCGKKLEMRETSQNNLTMMSKHHKPPLSEKEIEKITEPTEENLRILKEEDDIENPEEYLERKGKEYKDNLKNYCMCFHKRPENPHVFDLTKGLIKGSMPTVFIDINRNKDDKKSLEIALRSLKKGKFGIEIEFSVGLAYLWPCGEKFYGAVNGVETQDNLLASGNFDDAKRFANKWYGW